MTDEFPICPSCSKINSLRNVTATYPQVWFKDDILELETYLWCVSCRTMVLKKGLRYVYSKDDEAF